MAAVERFFGVGATTDDAATFKVRLDAAGTVKVRYSKNADLSSSTTSAGVVADANLYAAVSISGLDPHTVYYYEILVDDVAWSGDVQDTPDGDPPRFTTFPTEGQRSQFSFLVWSCASNGEDSHIWRTMRESAGATLPLFCACLGDLWYPDDGTFSGLTSEYRANYDVGSDPVNSDYYRHIVLMMSLVYIWDDHCFGGGESYSAFANKANALAAYKESFPHYPLASASNGIWQEFRCGHLHFYATDNRYQRTMNREGGGDPTGYEEFPAKGDLNDDTPFNTAGSGTDSTSLVLDSADSPPGTTADYYKDWYVLLKDPSGNTYYRRCTTSTAAASPDLTLNRAVSGLDDTWEYYIKDAAIFGAEQVGDIVSAMKDSTAAFLVILTQQFLSYDLVSDDNHRRLDPETMEVRYLKEELLQDGRDINEILALSGDAHRSMGGRPGVRDGRLGEQEYHAFWELLSSPADRSPSGGFGEAVLGKNEFPPHTQDPAGRGDMFGLVRVSRYGVVARAMFGGNATLPASKIPTVADIVLGAHGGVLGGHLL